MSRSVRENARHLDDRDGTKSGSTKITSAIADAVQVP